MDYASENSETCLILVSFTNAKSGCFCIDDLGGNNPTICAAQPTIVSADIPFAYWSYEVNGINVSSGNNSIPFNFTQLEPEQINLILDNGYCQIMSGNIYLSEDCDHSGSQSFMQNGSFIIDLESNTTQYTDQEAPLIMLMPNPAQNQTRIQFLFDESVSQKSIEIYDMTGRKIETIALENVSGTIALPLDRYITGIYEICLKQNGQVIAQTKLSVTR